MTSSSASASMASLDNVNCDRSGRKERMFLSVIFWYTIILTSLTPLSRVFYQEWYTVAPWSNGFYTTYPRIEDNPLMDKAFSYHASISILWVILAYIELVWTSNSNGKGGMNKEYVYYHRCLGYITLTVFVFHVVAALYTLYVNVEDHSNLNLTLLFFSLEGVVESVFSGMKHVVLVMKLERKKRKSKDDIYNHRHTMVEAFIKSLNGAGTVRTIGVIQTFLGVGPAICEAQFLSIGGHCDWTYTWRLLFTSQLTLIQRVVYRKLKKSKLDKAFVNECRHQAAFWMIIFISFNFGLTQNQTLSIVVVFQTVLLIFGQ